MNFFYPYRYSSGHVYETCTTIQSLECRLSCEISIEPQSGYIGLSENIFFGRTEGIFPDGKARGMISSIKLKNKFQIDSWSCEGFVLHKVLAESLSRDPCLGN